MAGRLLSIIDDDEDVRQSLLALVESVGYSARVFESADAFLKSDALATCQCIISDVQMAGLSGVELAERLAISHSQIPIILISAYAKGDILSTIRNPAVVAVLPKPLQMNALIDEISRLLMD
ncbi:response regulator transcription factor [Bradyrhizobium tunisiense]|uniref:response regulator transcription factor n=1 Tax=Bradyrhizobium tunisiense TaxID=3278709 RepID=UPI0035D7079D